MISDLIIREGIIQLYKLFVPISLCFSILATSH